MSMLKICAITLSLLLICVLCKQKYERKRMDHKIHDDGTWKSKDVRDFDEGDMEKLYQQWDAQEEELPVDELAPYELEPPPIDMSKIDIKNKDTLISEGKKHRTLMMFATVSGAIDRKRTEKVSAIWEQGLFNAGIQVKRFVIDDDRVLLQMDNGALAIQIKDYLIEQEDCLEVTLEQKTYDGKGKIMVEKTKPLTKVEMAAKKRIEAEKKAEREKIKQENKRKREEKEKKKKQKEKKQNKDEL